MTRFSLAPFTIACFMLSNAWGEGENVLKGTLLPKQDEASVSIILKNMPELTITEALPQGTVVKKGQSVATGDLRIMDSQLKANERYVKACELQMERMLFEWDQLQKTSENEVQAAKLSLKRAEENLKDFLDKRKDRMEEEENERVLRAERQLSYKEEEIKQLSKMYNDDQVSEETEEIILTRIKNELADMKFALSGARLVADQSKTIIVPRFEEDTKIALENSKLNLKGVEEKVKFALRQKQLDLDAAKETLEDARKKLQEWKEDREACDLKAPADGVLILGGYVGERWDAGAASKLRPGGKLASYDKVATIVPQDAGLVVVAVVPGNQALPGEGTAVHLKIGAEKEMPGTVSKASSFPSPDGSRVIMVTPSEKIFAPGLPVEIIVNK